MLFTTFVSTPALGPLIDARAFLIISGGNVVATAAPPKARPERRKKVRRSMASPAKRDWPDDTSEAFFLINFMACLL
jgi:hypothetical protein